MQCPKCKLDNLDGSKFYKECGTQITGSKDLLAQTKTIVQQGMGYYNVELNHDKY
jgi:uncharacterized membrane protein YvbJ